MATVPSFNPEDEGDHMGLVTASGHAGHSEDFEDTPCRNRSPFPNKVHDPLFVTRSPLHVGYTPGAPRTTEVSLMILS